MALDREQNIKQALNLKRIQPKTFGAKMEHCCMRPNPDFTMTLAKGQKFARCHIDVGSTSVAEAKLCPTRMVALFLWRGCSHLWLQLTRAAHTTTCWSSKKQSRQPSCFEVLEQPTSVCGDHGQLGGLEARSLEWPHWLHRVNTTSDWGRYWMLC